MKPMQIAFNANIDQISTQKKLIKNQLTEQYLSCLSSGSQLKEKTDVGGDTKFGD